jgi:mRNA export factor
LFVLKDNKQRLKGFNALQRSVSAAAFNAQGSLFAYASSYDWSKGSSSTDAQQGNEIFVHLIVDEEVRPKGKFKRDVEVWVMRT